MNYLLCTQRRFEADAVAAPLVFADEAIDFWSEVYLANPVLSKLGISFEAFLAQPREILPAAQFTALMPLTDYIDNLPLLPRQRAVRERLDARDAGQLALELALGISEKKIARGSAAIRDGRFVEKLRHRVWPRRKPQRAIHPI